MENDHAKTFGSNTVWYEDDPYTTDGGKTFFIKSVMVSDGVECIALVPEDALALLAWLEQEKPELERLAKEL